MKISKTTPLKTIRKLSKIECESCTHCCEYGSGIVLSEEIDNLAKKLQISKEELIKTKLDEFKNFNTAHYKFKTIKDDKQYGKCIFLDKDGCTIHEIKPLHCTIGSCNEHGEDLNLWFTLNHFVNPYDPESIREWARYIKLGNKILPGSELHNLVPDEQMLKKILEYEILR